MNEHYEKLFHALNMVKCELKDRNDTSLNQCIKHIKDAIIEAGRLNAQYANLSAQYDMFRLAQNFVGCDTADDWCED
jgi:hypothetical protein